MPTAFRGARFWLVFGAALLAAILVAAWFVFRIDVLRTSLDPKTPFQIYEPPRAPNYTEPRAWALLPNGQQGPADVFFIHPTTYDGGEHWNAPFRDGKASRMLERVMLPNYAGPFARAGRVFAPRYRQASLYAQLTLRDDAREARRFAYGDVLAAFRAWRERYGGDRPFIVVGVEQGGLLASRLLAEEIAADPVLQSRLAAAYLIETVIPADGLPIPGCTGRQQAGCIVAWKSTGLVERGRILERSVVWDANDTLVNLNGRQPLCVNPLTGGQGEAMAPARMNLGAANATGLAWDDRPALIAREVEARCEGGLLRVSTPKARSLKPTGGWADRLKAAPYNLFWADLEADAQARLAAQRP